MRLLIVLGIVSASGGLWAGPVGEYLGLQESKVWVYEGVEKDTIWEGASHTYNFSDTVKIVEEFIYQGDTAYFEKGVRVRDDLFAHTDTLWEEGDSLIHFYPLFKTDTLIPYIRYKVPFKEGNSWGVIWKNFPFKDLNGDGEKDTIRIRVDSIYVMAKENVSVPYGEIKDAYKIKRILRQEIHYTFAFPPPAVSVWRRIWFEWYKSELGVVKDSTYDEIAYLDVFGDTMGGHYCWHQKVLVEATGIKEKRQDKYPFFKIEECFLSKEISISFSLDRHSNIQLHLYDITGRERGKIERVYPAGNHTLKFTPENLPAGIYFLKITRDNKDTKIEKVIKM